MKKMFALACFALLLLQCKDAGPQNKMDQEQETEKMMPVEPDGGMGDGAPSLEDAFAQNIERAHAMDKFKEHRAIAFDLDLNFNGNDRFDARITMLPDASQIHMDKKDGSSLLFDGNQAYLSPKTTESESARFDMFTWSYFFSLPYKLRDPGTHFESLGTQELDGADRETYKLTFDSGTGDSPEDWYIIYLNEDGSIHAAGYIVTFKSTKKKAEENPHAIVYGDYKEVEGVPIATSWTFYNWTEKEGLSGDSIGGATLSNVNFVKPSERFFDKPESATIIE